MHGQELIYLDYAATTPADPAVVDAMTACLGQDGVFGNAASVTHAHGWAASDAVEQARARVAALINADPEEIVWTSGATESDNLAIKGVAEFHRDRGRHIVTARTEHKAVLDTCRYLQHNGWRVTYLTPDEAGLLAPEALEQALEDDTVLVSLMQVNNEIGVIQDIATLARIAHGRGALFHLDAAQSAGKVPLDVRAQDVDLVSLSGHKLYGPKGVGALYVRRRPRARLKAQMHGGGHERGMRSGTLPIHQIVGMGEACRIASDRMTAESEYLLGLRRRLESGLLALPAVRLNGHAERRAPHIANLTFGGVDGEALMADLTRPSVQSRLALAVSSGSACTAASQEPSYVLRALGRTDAEAQASIRFSVGRFTTAEDIDRAVARVEASLQRLRDLSPRWTPRIAAGAAVSRGA